MIHHPHEGLDRFLEVVMAGNGFVLTEAISYNSMYNNNGAHVRKTWVAKDESDLARVLVEAREWKLSQEVARKLEAEGKLRDEEYRKRNGN